MAGVGGRNEARGLSGILPTPDNRRGEFQGWPQRVAAASDQHDLPRKCLDGNGGLVGFLPEPCQAVLEKSSVGHKTINMACLPIRVGWNKGERATVNSP